MLNPVGAATNVNCQFPAKVVIKPSRVFVNVKKERHWIIQMPIWILNKINRFFICFAFSDRCFLEQSFQFINRELSGLAYFAKLITDVPDYKKWTGKNILEIFKIRFWLISHFWLRVNNPKPSFTKSTWYILEHIAKNESLHRMANKKKE